MAGSSSHGTQLKHLIITDILKGHQSLDLCDYLCEVGREDKEGEREREERGGEGGGAVA